MRHLPTYLIGLMAFLISTAQAQDKDHVVSPNWTFFPRTLYCSEISDGIGPQWRGQVQIGETTVEELEAFYGASEERDEMLVISGGSRGVNWKIEFCANEDNVITALSTGSDLAYFQDYIANYGIPDIVTYGINPYDRLMFWFEEGIAIDVYINTVSPEYYGLVSPVIFFPYQSSEDYANAWPFNRTRIADEAIPARDPYVSDEQNPFNFEAIVATITAEQSRTLTPTLLPVATVTQ